MFDDCQDIVKALQQDAKFKGLIASVRLTLINWGRILAQIVYYFSSFAVTANNDEKVPSGNFFGNICAGHIARENGTAS